MLVNSRDQVSNVGRLDKSHQSFGCCWIPMRDRISNVQVLRVSVWVSWRNVMQCWMEEARGRSRRWVTLEWSQCFIGSWRILCRGVKSCSDSESGTAAVRPSDPVWHQAFVSCQCSLMQVALCLKCFLSDNSLFVLIDSQQSEVFPRGGKFTILSS